MKNILLASILILLISPLALIASIGDSIHAEKYTISLHEINTVDKTINATTLVQIKPLVDDINEIRLQLKDLTITSVKIDNIAVTNFIHSNGILNIPLANPAGTADIVLVEVAYNGQPYHESWGGFHFSGDYAFNLGVGISDIPHNLGKSWFPCIDNFTDRAIYELFVTVADTLTAVCGGTLLEVTTPSPGKSTYHWELNNPIPTYLASVAIGEYVLVEHTYNGIADDIPIDYYVKPSQAAIANSNFENFDTIMNIFETYFGAYDWPRMGYVATAIGAMEHATNVAYPNSTITGGSAYEYLYAHELFHMWFGDKVTCDKAEEMWINEGWATFAQMFYKQILYDEETFKDEMTDTHAFVLQNVHNEEGGYHPMNNIPQEYTYGTSAYDRGATVVQTLRNYLTDAVFFPAMTAFLDDNAFTSQSSYGMRDFLTGNTGTDMVPFFDNWILNAGVPGYVMDSALIQPTDMGADVSVYVKQKRKGPAFMGDANKTDIYYLDENWGYQVETIEFDGETGMATHSVPFTPLAIFIDLEHNICDANTGEYHNISETGNQSFSNTFCRLETQQITDSAFVNVVHHWVAPDTFEIPVANLRLSDYRYWTINGVFPEDFITTGRFQYMKSSLDNTLILSETDSVIILYRENAGQEWTNIPFTQMGPWSIGYIYVENLQAGDYTLAVIDTQVGIDNSGITTNKNKELSIYPNPAKNYVNISYKLSGKGQIQIHNIKGQIVESISVSGKKDNLNLNIKKLEKGTYFVSLFDNCGNAVSSEKLIIN
ncbi:M1 family aminopeptidase [Bacteroidota bacterium]